MRFFDPQAIWEFFKHLGKGDPYAWGFVGFFALLATGFGLITLKFRRDLAREDAARAKKYGRPR